MAKVVALLEAEDYLKSIKYKFTQVEANALQTFKDKLVRNLFLGAAVGTAVVWRATRRFGYGHRINLAGGAGIFSGLVAFNRSADSALETFLPMEGSRLQSEFGKQLLLKNLDPRTTQIIDKYFYKENVYDDSSVDRTIVRWRHRSFFGENSAPGQRKHDDNYGAEHDDNYGADTDSEQEQVVEPTHSPVTPLRSSAEVSADPFDCLFGYSETLEEKSQPLISPEVPPKRRTRSHKKAARRHRKQRSQHAQAEAQHAQTESG
ncbi:hypothetical protein MKW94_005600 [Papaver nudicaule]|uniref:Uncharacterized protein n=1 Tax=Papaver nudicaule TaxID=74823 RepID=A0AA41SKX4_PAPNU|nr:hypothetical protein [Papaver nudicaule]